MADLGEAEEWPTAWKLHLASTVLRDKGYYIFRALCSLDLIASGYPHYFLSLIINSGEGHKEREGNISASKYGSKQPTRPVTLEYNHLSRSRHGRARFTTGLDADGLKGMAFEARRFHFL